MNADGSNPQVLASLGGAGAVFPSFSHNGNELCFNSQVRPRDIYIVNIDGTGLTNLTSQTGDNLRCDWSPKGNSIAFGSTRDGNEEIYVMNADGSDVVRLTGDLVAGQTPHRARTQTRPGHPTGTESRSRATSTATPTS